MHHDEVINLMNSYLELHIYDELFNKENLKKKVYSMQTFLAILNT